MKVSRIMVNLFAIFAIVCGAFPAAAAETFIVKDGQANAEIVIAEKPERSVRLAVGELQTYVQKITGARLPIVTAPGGQAIKLFIGRSPHTDKLGVKAEGLKYGAYRLVSGDDWLAFIGDDTDFVPPPEKLRYTNRGGIKDELSRVRKEWQAAAGGPWELPGIIMYMRREQTSLPADIGMPDAAPRPGKNETFGMWGYDERGSYNAVIGFLNELGVRWLLPGELGEIVPQMTSIALPRIDRTVRPDFEVRSYPLNMNEWTFRLGVRMPWWSSTEHGLCLLQTKEIFEAHPEWFALYGGKRDIKQLCLSSEGVFQETLRLVRAQFDVYNFESVSVMPNDAFIAMCQCDLCKGKDDPRRPEKGRMSDYVWGFVNHVAKEIAKTHPKKTINCCAYNDYRLPPNGIEKLEPNVQVAIINGRMRPHDTEDQAEKIALRESWLKKTDRPIWPYNNGPYTGGGCYLPTFAPHTVGKDINAIKGMANGDLTFQIGIVGRWKERDAFNAFHIYFVERMHWGGKEQNPEALLDEYCRLLYGPAGDAMKAFFNYCETNWRYMTKDKIKVDAALDLFDKAKAKAAPESLEARRLAPLDQWLNGLRVKAKLIGQKRGVVPHLRLVGDARDIVIDGRLDEPFWTNINPGSVGYLREVATGRQPALGTTVKSGWYNNHLYFAIRCDEVPGEKPNVTAAKRDDQAIFFGDDVEILLETPMHSYYQIAVNPAGAVCDLDRANGASKWDSMAEVATLVADDHWTVEIRIPVTESDADPLHQVVGRIPSADFPWFFNVCRQRQRENGVEHSALSPTGKGFLAPMSFAHLYSGPSHKFEADPTVTNYIGALSAAQKLPKAEALAALVALAEGSQGKLSDLQQSDALKQAAAAARALKDFARADELAARIPVEVVKKTVLMHNLLEQKKAAEMIEKFGGEDIAAWPFWAAGEGYFVRGRAFAAAGERGKAESDFKAALPLAGDPRVREGLLKALGELTGKAE